MDIKKYLGAPNSDLRSRKVVADRVAKDNEDNVHNRVHTKKRKANVV